MASATTEAEHDIPPTAEQLAQEWIMPPGVGLGSKILFAQDPNEMANPDSRGHAMGFIVKMGRRSVDITCLVPGGWRQYVSVRCIDDPLVAQNPQWFEEHDTGVFRLADSELKLQELEAMLNRLQADLATLLAVNRVSKPKRP